MCGESDEEGLPRVRGHGLAAIQRLDALLSSLREDARLPEMSRLRP